MLCGDDSQGKTYGKGEDERHERKREGNAHTLGDHVRDGQLRARGDAKAAAEDPLDPIEVLGPYGLVEMISRPYRLELRFAYLFGADEGARGVASCQIEQPERHDRKCDEQNKKSRHALDYHLQRLHIHPALEVHAEAYSALNSDAQGVASQKVPESLNVTPCLLATTACPHHAGA